MRLLVPFYLLLLAFHAPDSPGHQDEVLGKWIRVDDAYQGMKIEVIRDQDQLVGRIVSMPATAMRFQIGDIKWKDIHRTGPGAWQFNSLVISVNHIGQISHRRYDATRLDFIGPDEIHTQTIRFRPGKTGNFQKWIREKPA